MNTKVLETKRRASQRTRNYWKEQGSVKRNKVKLSLIVIASEVRQYHIQVVIASEAWQSLEKNVNASKRDKLQDK